ncbi:hypothetical protein BGW36DRAFT_356184 [Talaromyces proteolyticus]|uniref:Golgi apparatus membrane protein TVP38 n=1 Tax=Talaromyces proteolyticus TaxID=1131652 RepID=A0AAD4KX06_9EURO|nr:uncharacterized protein BGW36DRAFT_356184 [Talaromyces proteolyticus]KAH8702039.1 hypothetical protein BGW36DRAFT_356184 [Talaromyces proteolyticus]
MPADYQSTARALSLPISESEESDTPLFAGILPPWSQSSIMRRGSLPLSTREAATFRDRMINKAEATYRTFRDRWSKMTLKQKLVSSLIGFLSMLAGLAFLFFAGRIFIWLGPVADRWEHAPWAYIVVWLSVILVSFPPMVGWSTIGTVSGFLFGFWKGWILFTTATIVGSTLSLIVSRTILSSFVHRLLENDKRFAALALTLKYDGLKLLCMIRLCPLPYSICNGAMSTFPTVKPLSYAIATAAIAPKLMVTAFIGSRIRILSENNEQMSAGSKAINIISIIVTVSIGIGTGIYIYRRTLARAKELEEQERAAIRRSIDADHAAGRPHRFSDDRDVNTAATTLARDEEEQLGFHDIDEDNVDIVVEGDNLDVHGTRSYRDDFTDNDSDVFQDDDGEDSEAFGLHTHVQR